MKVKRYDPDAADDTNLHMEESVDGGWVDYDDYLAMLVEKDAEIARLKKQLEVTP